jgi:Bifunctional DNA primase/polymerase, N-terminal
MPVRRGVVAVSADITLEWAKWYVRQHWHWELLLLAVDSRKGKVPPRNCDQCAAASRNHDKQACPCLLCHGVYMATRDMERFAYMLRARPLGYLAARTGSRTRLVVVDAEAPGSHGHVDDGVSLFGTRALDSWASVAGWELPPTLTSRSVEGGLHLFYELPAGATVQSGGLGVAGVEVKGEGGYVGVPCGRPDRGWVDPHAPVAPAPAELLSARARQSGNGWSYRAKTKEEVRPFPTGERWRSLVSLAGTMRTRPEFDADAIEAALWEVNLKLCRPPHDRTEIRRIAEAADATWTPSLPDAADVARLQDVVRRWTS